MKADYVHKDTLTATDYVELNKNNELLMSYNQALLKEKQELKKQLEEINNFISKAGFVNILQLMLDYCAKVQQQKEFIEWLESMLVSELDVFTEVKICDVLSKYKEIIGG